MYFIKKIIKKYLFIHFYVFEKEKNSHEFDKKRKNKKFEDFINCNSRTRKFKYEKYQGKISGTDSLVEVSNRCC
jgi:hypothetical protein